MKKLCCWFVLLRKLHGWDAYIPVGSEKIKKDVAWIIMGELFLVEK